jgi:hypothetical protein
MMTIEPVLSVSVEPIYVDERMPADPFVVTRTSGRSRLVIEGEDAIVAVLLEQAVEAVEHLKEISDRS